MYRKCQISAKGTRAGNNISHSHRKTKRTFKKNVHKHRIYIPEKKKWVTLVISTRILRDIQKVGLLKLLKNHNCVDKKLRLL